MVDVRSSSLGSISCLPDELINLMLLNHHLEEIDLARLSLVSRVWRVLACEDALWLHFCFRNHNGKITYLVSIYRSMGSMGSMGRESSSPLPPYIG